jgi:glycosyltransferase involved in cell wall biosynthesis
MLCPTLNELPEPPAGKHGWPWTEESARLSDTMANGQEWPRITVVTPSFRQGRFLEETIRSILLQGYPNLEYFVLDGGSKDNSVEIITKYSPWLSYWMSEPDGGQSDAINRGLRMGSGEFATWINSDDMLCKNALADHGTRVGFQPNTVYVGICVYMNETSDVLHTHRGRVKSLEDLIRIRAVWRSRDGRGHIVQPEVLFPRVMSVSVGALDPNNYYTMDYELWGKLFLAGAKFEYTDIHFGMFREYPNQKSQHGPLLTRSLLHTAAKLVKNADCFSEQVKDELLADLETYDKEYSMAQWRGSGRLAKIGLPRQIVIPLRNLRDLAVGRRKVKLNG